MNDEDLIRRIATEVAEAVAKEIVPKIAKEVAKEVAHELLQLIGIDTSDVFSAQKNFKHLEKERQRHENDEEGVFLDRKWVRTKRESSEKTIQFVKQNVWKAAIFALLAIVAYALFGDDVAKLL